MLTSTQLPVTPRAMGVNLVLFLASALCALLLLTQTLVSVTEAQASVKDALRPATSGIVKDTALLPTLSRTDQLARGMLRFGHDVNASLTDVGAATQRIAGRFDEVRAASGRIDASVAGIAASSTDVRRLASGLDTDVAATDRTAGGVASALSRTERAVGSLAGMLAQSRMTLDALLAVVPSISQEARVMSRVLTDVDGHLAAIYANRIVRLTNLLELRILLSSLGLDGGR